MHIQIQPIRFSFLLAIILSTLIAKADNNDPKLTGTVIGTPETVDYSTFQKSTTVNTCAMAFDGNLDTYFASWERSYTWAGLDLGTPHVITKVGWSPRNDGQGEKRMVLGVFEGANSEDFMDALPLYIITEKGIIGQRSYADVACSRGFRYVRYVGPSDARCNVAELEFYGHEGTGDDSHLYQPTNLPVVTIHTKDNVEPYDKENQIEAQITLISEDGTTLLSEPGTIRERGNASRYFPKKPWRIKFDEKQHVLDAPAKAKKWTLINNYGDKTLMRNLLAFELSRRMGMPYTPFGTAVDVLLNGEYKGTYQLCDQIDVKKNRVDITEMTPLDNTGVALSGGYLFEIDAYAYDEKSWFYSNRWNPVTIKSPDDDEITPQQSNYIKNHFNKMEANWRTYLDLDTFLRHFLVGELSGNTDTYWSVFMYKQRGDDLIYTGPVWDFDLAFENDNRTYPVNSNNDYIYRTNGSCAGNMRSFVDNIVINDNNAKKQLVEIWDEARLGGLTVESMTEYIDQWEQTLQASQRLNFLRWPIMNEYVHQNPKIWGSYAAEVKNVRRFMQERIAWMDRRLGYTYNAITQHPSTNTLHPSPNTQTYIYSLSGTLLGQSADGYKNILNALPAGTYIIRQGDRIRKVSK